MACEGAKIAVISDAYVCSLSFYCGVVQFMDLDFLKHLISVLFADLLLASLHNFPDHLVDSTII